MIASFPRRGLLLVLAPVFGLLLITVPLFLAGTPNADAEQARLCRMLLPALYSEDEGIRVLASEPGQRSAVHITFQTSGDKSKSEGGNTSSKSEGGNTSEHLLTCRFGGIGYSAAKRDLAAVLVDGVGLGEAAFYFVRERWLESRHAVTADPGAPDRGTALLQLSRSEAVALQHLVNGLPRTGILALLALATALIYGLIGRINLAFGEFAALGGIAASMCVVILAVSGFSSPLPVSAAAILAALALSALYGLVMGRSILWPLSNAPTTGRGGAAGQPLLVAGVGMLVAVQEGLRLAQGAGTLWLPPVSGDTWRIASAPGFDVVAHPRLLAMVALDWLAIGVTLRAMHKSPLGRAWRASADDPLAASLCGINPRRLLITISALATLLAGLAGATITLNYGGMHFSGGTLLGLTGLIAAILGGIGSLGGAVLGGVVIAAFQVGWSATRDIAHWELATFTLLTLALILKPGGFFGFADGAQRKV